MHGCHDNDKVETRNVISTTKYTPTIKTSIYHPQVLGRFLSAGKCNISVITQAFVLCLIYTHSPLGAARPRASCVYIRQSTLASILSWILIAQNSGEKKYQQIPVFRITWTSHQFACFLPPKFSAIYTCVYIYIYIYMDMVQANYV